MVSILSLRLHIFALLVGVALNASEAYADRLELEIGSESQHWMETTVIRVTGSIPGGKVRIEAAMIDDSGVTWTSRGVYFADHRGKLDVSSTASVAGTYTGVDGEGLIWSMLPTTAQELDSCSSHRCAKADWPRRPVLDVSKETEIVFRATAKTSFGRSTNSVTEARQKVSFMSQGVKRRVIAEKGVRGVLFSPPGRNNSLPVLFVTGSEGGVFEYTPALLASEGFTVLSIAYFNYDDLPATLSNIPLEYFGNAINWLRDITGQRRVAVSGMSRGGEAALLIASAYPKRVSAVVAIVPSNLAWMGCCGPEAGSSWTYHNKPVPAARFEINDPGGDSEKTPRALSYREDFLRVIAETPLDADTFIPVQKIKAPILLITGDADEVWPASIAAERIIQKIQGHNLSFDVQHSLYTGAGHSIALSSPVNSLDYEIVHRLMSVRINLGGTPQLNARATRSAFWDQVSFLRNQSSNH